MTVDRTASGWFKAHDEAVLTECGETLAVVRKKVLLRILARHDAERAGLQITETEIVAASAEFRRGFGLEKDDDFEAWLAMRNLSRAEFARTMHDFALVTSLERAYKAEIDELVHEQIAVSTARLRSGG